jgi:hypothetical protein
MSRKAWVWLSIVVGFCFFYAWSFASYSYRFRLTVDVDTAGGVKTGSSVLEVTTYMRPPWFIFAENNSNTKLRGEAVFVDLGNGKNLVSLLALGPGASDGNVDTLAVRTFFNYQEGAYAPEWSKTLARMPKAYLGRRAYTSKKPTLATFTVPNNQSSSIREVPVDDPQSVLGSDVRAVRFWIELTRDAMTSTLKQRLPWIDDYQSINTARTIINQGRSGGASMIFQQTGEY